MFTRVLNHFGNGGEISAVEERGLGETGVLSFETVIV
jgi:hypothetical protein